MKGIHRFGVKGKLVPRYIGPFRILQQCGPVAYQLELPPHLSSTHDVFHVSQLKKCLRVPSEAIEIEAIQLESDLTYQEHPIKILDQKERATRRRAIKSYKVQCCIIQKKKPSGKQKTICELTFQNFSLPTEEEICA